ncbi:MAG TPA: hypothetical protein VM912_07900, partial [Terriglobales bacterium]|nr:hypothetical protein [Terriglobales bacterium]
SERSGLVRNEPFVVRAFASTTAFRDATLEPGWIAAFTEGHWIATQPLHTLAARHLLDETMRHEFLHVFVESEAVPNTPLWLREGLVEAWSDSGNGKSDRAPALTIEAVDGALRTATNEKGSLAAHCAAGWYAERLLHDYGRGRVIAWLRSGVPANVVIHLGQRQTN